MIAVRGTVLRTVHCLQVLGSAGIQSGAGEKMERLPSKQRLLCSFQTLCDFHCAEAIALM